MQYVINRKTGCIFIATDLLLKHKNCVLAPPDAVEMHTKHGVDVFKVHEGSGSLYFEPIPPAGLTLTDLVPAEQLSVLEQMNRDKSDAADESDVVRPPLNVVQSSPAPESGELSVADDFDVDVNISNMNKFQLIQLGQNIKGLTVPLDWKPKDLREHIANALAKVRVDKAAQMERKAADEAALAALKGATNAAGGSVIDPQNAAQ